MSRVDGVHAEPLSTIGIFQVLQQLPLDSIARVGSVGSQNDMPACTQKLGRKCLSHDRVASSQQRIRCGTLHHFPHHFDRRFFGNAGTKDLGKDKEDGKEAEDSDARWS